MPPLPKFLVPNFYSTWAFGLWVTLAYILPTFVTLIVIEIKCSIIFQKILVQFYLFRLHQVLYFIQFPEFLLPLLNILMFFSIFPSPTIFFFKKFSKNTLFSFKYKVLQINLLIYLKWGYSSSKFIFVFNFTNWYRHFLSYPTFV